MSGDQLDLDAIEARANGATPGPWRDRPMGSEGSDVIAGGNTIRTARRPARCREFADATFIAHAREDVPALVAEVRRLREERDRLLTERENVRAVAAQPGRTPNGHRWT